MALWRTYLTTNIAAGTTAPFSATIKDDEGVAIPGDDLDTLTLTLYEYATGAVINNRNALDVLNANDGTVSPGGVLAFLLTADDNVAVAAAVGRREAHVIMLDYTWDTTKAGRHEVVFDLTNNYTAPEPEP